LDAFHEAPKELQSVVYPYIVAQFPPHDTHDNEHLTV
jgi:hypothetical protein